MEGCGSGDVDIASQRTWLAEMEEYGVQAKGYGGREHGQLFSFPKQQQESLRIVEVEMKNLAIL